MTSNPVELPKLAETLETASKTAASTKALWENVKLVLHELPALFGVAKSFLDFSIASL